MTSYLAYSYSISLTNKERVVIDNQVKKTKKNFCKGFAKGTQCAILIYSFYALANSAAYAADPSSEPGSQVSSEIEHPPNTTPPATNQPVGDGSNIAEVSGTGSFFGPGTAFPSGTYGLGLSCSILLILGGIIIYPPKA